MAVDPSGRLIAEATMKVRTRALVVLAAICATLIAIAVYVARRPTCETDDHAMKGEVRRQTDGRLLYFDGRCWTTKPMPPRDSPF
jgi:hypothetical protein